MKLADDEERGAEESGNPTASGSPGRGWRKWVLILGVIVIPILLYAAIPVVSLLPLATGQKVWISGGLVVVAETIFFVSALVLGREAVRRYRRYLNPRNWFGKGPR